MIVTQQALFSCGYKIVLHVQYFIVLQEYNEHREIRKVV